MHLQAPALLNRAATTAAREEPTRHPACHAGRDREVLEWAVKVVAVVREVEVVMEDGVEAAKA